MVNAFHSERVQAEYILQAARPSTLPSDDAGMGCPIQNGSRLAAPPSLISETTTGKGQGSHMAGVMPTAARSTYVGSEGLKTVGCREVMSRGNPEVSKQGDDDGKRWKRLEVYRER